jgi:GNAT superfamily N-acetyltransferase
MRVTRTYLQLGAPGQFGAAFGDFPDVAVARVPDPAPALYRLCYRTVGAQHHWRDRWDWSDAEIHTHFADPDNMLHVALRAGSVAGYYELRRVADDASVEIAYFGLAPGELGHGLGKHLLSHAVHDAWTLQPTRVWLHTCTLDHPNALPNYVARGFVPYKTEAYEVDSVA